MKNKVFFFLIVAGMILSCASAFAQSDLTISGKLIDENSGESVGFATVSLSVEKSTKVYKYALSNSEGNFTIEKVRAGKYVLKAEMMGYQTYIRSLEIKDDHNVGDIIMIVDQEQLDAAKVTDVGNPIVVKKDTIEYNASSFKTTDNDMLEDLLKKLPGVEVSESGAITVNGETITQVYIDGKTFFMDDPQLASKNLPAKIIQKVKVVQKKSEQAEFTGIDDGQEETVLDLSIQQGMMNGIMGNLMLAGGHDIPSETTVYDDFRYQSTAFIGNFTDKTQISLIGNANNANNMGSNDFAGGMMGGMMGGGRGMGGMGGMGGGGVTSSYLTGLTGGGYFFDDKMEFTGNYMLNGSDRDVQEITNQTTYLDTHNLIYDTKSFSNQKSNGHSFGLRIEHEFSDNTSIIFQPQFSFGKGGYSQASDYTTFADYLNGTSEHKNDGFSLNTGDNQNWSTSGMFMFRQRLGLPGRTVTVNLRYSLSNNITDGFNQSYTNNYVNGIVAGTDIVNQRIDQSQKNQSITASVNYTEPLGNYFYVEANYNYSWNKSISEKNTFNSGDFTVNNNSLNYNPSGEIIDPLYSNNIINEYINQSAGINMLYQNERLRAQVGASILPTKTHNATTKGTSYGIDTTFTVINWSPTAMVMYDFNDNTSTRVFYRGNSSQPSTSQLMPVPDNSNPLNVSLGNPSLAPYFSHSFNGDIRYSNREKFSSFNLRFNGSFTQSPIVNALWYDNTGAQYSMPFNGPTSMNASVNFFVNTPIAKSNFSINSNTSISGSKSGSYVGTNVDNSFMNNGDFDYTGFLMKYNDINNTPDFKLNSTETMNISERLNFSYRSDYLEIRLGGSTRYSKSWYTIANTSTTATWNNQLNASLSWTWEQTGISIDSDMNYRWYRGYTTPMEDEYVLNAEISKLIFNNRMTLALRGYDILGQSKNLRVTDESNFHSESINNTLGRYVVVSLTYRFGTFGGPGGGRGRGGFGGPGGGRGRGGFGGPMGGGRGPR